VQRRWTGRLFEMRGHRAGFIVFSSLLFCDFVLHPGLSAQRTDEGDGSAWLCLCENRGRFPHLSLSYISRGMKSLNEKLLLLLLSAPFL
jgi:hypothetical protein